ncbi:MULTISPECIES: hypothetical protein [Brevundimonas]|jgi:hypothetical protein|uniref:hypothetical protein n=1 Tax=Brevundimonas TaxID=41275 RepID=UPI0019037745|nr:MULTISPECIES: hypothetical protein [Brevundimonas]MDA0743832.1 hypothetical protein [Pseudomonadota bacterium]MBK1969241.1 hypothetical protein [Brevundimonas diminuta]MBK1976007.1 hypothetical protein [Brevundimonas diminuta]MDA1321234.1 hypothetical protein [Pseudomonadota bacterium]MDM8352592.1 hypothetical protein [Brevundimonas diminuta]
MRLFSTAVAAAVLLNLPGLALAQEASVPTDNAEMAAIFVADQAVRQNIDPARFRDRAFVEQMNADDAARRERTRALLDAGALQTGEDFRAAAFVFQHGSTPEDYLLAHSLAVTGVAKGSKQAAWIAAASLDRFLQSVDRKQIYGTQTRMMNGGEPTLEPYDRDLLPAAVRAAAGVPNLAEQDARLEQFRVARQAAAPQP